MRTALSYLAVVIVAVVTIGLGWSLWASVVLAVLAGVLVATLGVLLQMAGRR